MPEMEERSKTSLMYQIGKIMLERGISYENAYDIAVKERKKYLAKIKADAK